MLRIAVSPKSRVLPCGADLLKAIAEAAREGVGEREKLTVQTTHVQVQNNTGSKK